MLRRLSNIRTEMLPHATLCALSGYKTGFDFKLWFVSHVSLLCRTDNENRRTFGAFQVFCIPGRVRRTLKINSFINRNNYVSILLYSLFNVNKNELIFSTDQSPRLEGDLS